VPVFNDKHLSFNWRQARRMVDISKELKFSYARRPRRCPSHTGFRPSTHHLARPRSTPSPSPIAGLIFMASMYSRHSSAWSSGVKGGETGVSSVQCFEKGELAGTSSSRTVG